MGAHTGYLGNEKGNKKSYSHDYYLEKRMWQNGRIPGSRVGLEFDTSSPQASECFHTRFTVARMSRVMDCVEGVHQSSCRQDVGLQHVSDVWLGRGDFT